ncbi:MAG: L,D-transpeptidase [Tissierellia bacterium]|nr:L,D-transpeptidase [Tissierellia bacterium]
MVKIRALERTGLLMFIFLLFFANIGFANSITNEDVLRNYVSSKYNGNILEQRNTLLRFQAENNLLVDGIIGAMTEKALTEEQKEIVDIIPEEIEDKGWFIVINKTKKILTVYRNGRVYKKYPVALGKTNTPTPSYKFTITNKAKNPYWNGMGGKFKPIKGGAPNNPLGKRWLGLTGGKYTGYGIHGNSNPYSIGQNISAGCIRMINEDIDELFKYIPIRTNVWIGTEEQLEEWGIKQDIEYKKIKKICCIRGQVM